MRSLAGSPAIRLLKYNSNLMRASQLLDSRLARDPREDKRSSDTRHFRGSKDLAEDRRPRDAKEVVAIFKSNYSEEVYDRKAREVSKFLESRPQGFSYNELRELTQITVGAAEQSFILYDLSKGYIREMKDPFVQILKKARLGFRKEHIFDDRIMFEHISEFLNTFR